MNKPKLTDQLLLVCVAIISIVIISLGIILPKNLLPIYEDNLYNYLKQPLLFMQDPEDIKNKINAEVAYIYVNDDSSVSVSNNLLTIINIKDIKDILGNVTEDYGKFKYSKTTYYYNTIRSSNNDEIRIAITNDAYINNMKKDILEIILTVVGITFIIISLLVIAWSNHLVNRIKKLKDKIDNINNDDYNHNLNYNYGDELYTLAVAIENMRIYLKEQEEYKNQMYQNISHDFKTPITVIKSYIEAYEDDIESQEKTFEVINEQIKKLEIKVHSLLYLNKLNYIQDKKTNITAKHDVAKTIYDSVEKFRVSRPGVNFVLEIDKKNTTFRGTPDMWEAIIDNILNNFTRYAEKEIKITIKNSKITLYNDGPNIDENVLNNIFTPYEKGIKGIFGLGLSIVKKTLHFLDYDITIENTKNGVKFIIS